MDHPNIVRLFEVFQDSKRYYLVTELCTGGELFDKFVEQKTLSERAAAVYMKQILSAVVYCHASGVVHRDLKPENLLLESSARDAKLKVIDFGTSQTFRPGSKMTTKIGTPLYIAPEVLSKDYTEKCDVWSCGVILYILLSGQAPFSGYQETEILQKIKRGVYTMSGPNWRSISPGAKDLVKFMLMYNPEKRFSAKQALLHPWIREGSREPSTGNVSKSMLNDLSLFSAQHKLQQAALTYIVSQWTTSKEKAQLQSAFMELDTDKDGRLGREELILGFHRILGEDYPAEEEVNRVMQNIDIDHNGYIDFTEFVMATINKKNLLTRERLVAAFKMFDRDGGGTISYDEIKEILGVGCNIPDEQWKEVVKEVDENGDGEISLEEFITMMEKLLK